LDDAINRTKVGGHCAIKKDIFKCLSEVFLKNKSFKLLNFNILSEIFLLMKGYYSSRRSNLTGVEIPVSLRAFKRLSEEWHLFSA
jgi:hypothetical protein